MASLLRIRLTSHVLYRALAIAFVLTVGPGPSWAGPPPDFVRDIRPILAAKCLACHGPDKDAREADLRLDTRDGALADLGGYQAVTPGQPDKSELVKRIESPDPDTVMPPPDSKLTLNSAEKQKLRDWVAAGAPYAVHWAFVPPRRPALPVVRQTDWVKNPIDHFVLARIEQAGLHPSPEADRSTLIRRVYLDLIGLPPSPEEVQRFLADQRPDAYERLVDRLLASPHYGERWARPWLDLARYADTNGYEKDLPRSIWPYRDWVIQALNDDMPFDQFTIEQLAGDLLPNATLSQRIATGFHRNTMLNEEGGVDVEQFRYESLIDRVNTTATVWLGLTMGCAQCHSHKYDPIQQEEFYELLAFFNTCDEPTLSIPDAEIARQRARHEKDLERKLAQLESKWPAENDAARRAAVDARFQQWLSQKSAAAHDWVVLEPQLARAKNGSTFQELSDHSLLVGGDRPNQDIYQVAFRPPVQRITALRIEALPHESLPDGGPGQAPLSVGKIITKGDFLLSEFEVFRVPADRMSQGIEDYAESPEGWQKLPIEKATATYAAPQSPPELTLDGNLDTGWRIGERTGEAQHIVFSLAQPLDLQPGDQLVVRLNQAYIHNMILGRFRVSATADALPVLSTGLPAEAEAALRTPPNSRSPETMAMLRSTFLWTAPELAKAQAEIRAFRKTKPQYVTTLVMAERPQEFARVTHRHQRGEYLQPREEVLPDVPDSLHDFPQHAPRNRLGLAQWLVSPRNPLVARVTMNRHWQEFFGRGIVRTSEDFGTQSSPPTHPKLLDYLAVEFMENGWSVKKMHRLIVTSATYRQSSRVTPELLQKDPDNTLLARAPRVRLDAETIRDAILASAGLLTRRIGGPSVFPPQPAGVTSLSYGALKWETAQGEDRYRRGLYTFAKRTAPYAMFTTFDAPTRETCVVRRGRSNTPLQALTLLNDVVFTEAAQTVGRHLAQSATPPAAGVDQLYLKFLARKPDAFERSVMIEFYNKQRDRLLQSPDQARELCAIGKKGEADPEQLARQAAWTAVARVMINLDETITRN